MGFYLVSLWGYIYVTALWSCHLRAFHDFFFCGIRRMRDMWIYLHFEEVRLFTLACFCNCLARARVNSPSRLYSTAVRETCI
ncbi:hypothetical protein BDV26DRAFT_276931 [Aspergillus bertholletiae]|uniref:Uncharacterized protein n=1 Tax=Aspergillus bertholletiae TaxID=1226010 RepID=A0A5N7APR9_9EURO|nr:hypothetical protein BDV26DRAFT_276931 [Aspergillus bertholletiae]